MLTNKPQKAATIVAPPPAVTKTSSAQKLYLSFTDTSTKTTTVTDANLKKIYSLSNSSGYISIVGSDGSGDVLFQDFDKDVSIPSVYKLVDAKGQQKTLSPKAVTILESANGDRGSPTIFLKSSTEAALTTCTYQKATNNNKCDLSVLNLSDGSTQSVLSQIQAPIASDTGDAFFALKGISPSHQTVYLEVAGPTTLGKDDDAVYSVDLISKKVTLLASIPTESRDVTVSPDGKKVVYATKPKDNGPIVLHIIDTTSSKDTAVDWINESIVEAADTWQWSPDSTKALFFYQTSLGYLDLTKNTASSLQNITDTSHNTVSLGSYGWIDETNVIYNAFGTSDSNNFTNGSSTIYKVNTTNKTATKLSAPTGYLKVYY